MKKNQIFIKCGTEYKEMTKELLEACDLEGEIEKKFETKSSLIDNSEAEVDCFCSSDFVEKQNSEFGLYNMRIGIKPNLVAPMEACWGGTTHPEVVAGIVEYLQEKGFSNLVIMEGSWVGDKTSESYEVCGFKSLCEKYNVPFLDMQKEKGVPVQCGDMTLNICKSVLDLDFLINVPVLKGHCQTKITCALKNMKGLLPNSEKRRFHALGLHDPIAHLGLAIPQDFIMVDNICGDLDFEDGGNPVEMNRVLAAVDPVLMDAYVCDMMYYQVEEVHPILGVEPPGPAIHQDFIVVDHLRDPVRRDEPRSGSCGSGSYGCLRLRHDVLPGRRGSLHHKGCHPWCWLRRHPPGRNPRPRR